MTETVVSFKVLYLLRDLFDKFMYQNILTVDSTYDHFQSIRTKIILLKVGITLKQLGHSFETCFYSSFLILREHEE